MDSIYWLILIKIRPRKVKIKDEEEPGRKESMSASDRACKHSNKETKMVSSHQSNMVLEDQNEDKARPRLPIKRTRYMPQERK